MTEATYLSTLAKYNQIMNQRQYDAVAKLADQDLREDKGAFFKSVLGTLNHILVGDIIWLKRFASHPLCRAPLSYLHKMDKPESLDSILFSELSALRREREKIDKIIIEWTLELPENCLTDCISYTNVSGNSYTKPLAPLINHLFLHQVHHRGQVTTLLSQSGVDFGETDFVEFIPNCDKQ